MIWNRRTCGASSALVTRHNFIQYGLFMGGLRMGEDVGTQVIKEIRNITSKVKRIAELLRALESHLDLMASSPPWFK
jgi:hypothetical protein